ncbi:MAG: MFS transporter [Chloroflexi bacterium]|nr:MFS transporter [Chloroflexota bacterium]
MGYLLANMAREDPAIGPAVVGVMHGVFYAAELSGAPWFGALSDRRGPRPFMIAGPLFGAVAIQLIGWPRSIPLMAVGRVVEGLSTASSVPSTLSYLTSATAEDPVVRTRTMAWYEMATVAGIAAGYVIAGILWEALRSGAFLAVTAVYGASVAAFLSTRGGAPTRQAARQAGALSQVLTQPRLLRFAPAWLAINTVVGTWFAHAAFILTGPVLFGQQLAGSLTSDEVSLALGLVGGAFIVGICLWGMFAGHLRRTSVMLMALPGAYSVCLALLALNHLQDADAGRAQLFMGTLLIAVAVASGFTPAALSYLADLSEDAPHLRGATMGLYSVLLGLGQLLGGVIGAPFAQLGGVDGLIALTALLTSAATITVLVLRRSEPIPLAT